LYGIYPYKIKEKRAESGRNARILRRIAGFVRRWFVRNEQQATSQLEDDGIRIVFSDFGYVPQVTFAFDDSRLDVDLEPVFIALDLGLGGPTP